MNDSPMSDVDIAAALHVSTDTVKKTADSAIKKIQDNSALKEIRLSCDDEPVVPSEFSVDDETIYC